MAEVHSERKLLFVSCFYSFTVSLVTVTTSLGLPFLALLSFSPPYFESSCVDPGPLQSYRHISGYSLHPVQSLPAQLHAHALGSVNDEATRKRDPMLLSIILSEHTRDIYISMTMNE